MFGFVQIPSQEICYVTYINLRFTFFAEAVMEYYAGKKSALIAVFHNHSVL